MSEIVLIRPGCTDFDEQHRIQGTLDLPLNRRGEEQVQSLVEQLRGFDLELIVTGPSDPARSTAEAIGEALDVTVKEVDDLRNLNQGLWQGLRLDDIRRKFPKVYKQWKESPESICPPEGEAVSEALDRVEKVVSRYLKRREKVAIVAPEPLASLITFVITGQKSETSGAICGDVQLHPIELVSRDGVIAVTPVGQAAGGAGQDGRDPQKGRQGGPTE